MNISAREHLPPVTKGRVVKKGRRKLRENSYHEESNCSFFYDFAEVAVFFMFYFIQKGLLPLNSGTFSFSMHF